MKIIIATKNKGKIEGSRLAFSEFFNDIEIEGVAVESNVPDQPVNLQIYEGAKNRVNNLKDYCVTNGISADFYISIESGITNLLGEWMITNIAVIEDCNGVSSFGTSPSFPVPTQIVNDIIETDLSKVMDKIFGEDEQRSTSYGGIQLLTHGVISRIDLTKSAFVMALTKFINGSKWK